MSSTPNARNSKCGELTVIVGAMFAGKSSEIVRLLNRSAVVDRNCTYVMPGKATRDFITHCRKIGLHDRVATKNVSNLSELDVKAGDVIGIDEGQFFENLPECVIRFMNAGCTVFVASLDGDFKGRPFGRVHELQSYATTYQKLNAVCKHCVREYGIERPANRTWKRSASENIEEIGGADIYESLCNDHYQQFTYRP